MQPVYNNQNHEMNTSVLTDWSGKA